MRREAITHREISGKKDNTTKKKFFVYAFCLMDLAIKMYTCFGTSMRSEKETFDKAMETLKRMDISKSFDNDRI